MVDWHVEKKATCIYSQVKAAPLLRLAVMIQGILRHCTDAGDPRKLCGYPWTKRNWPLLFAISSVFACYRVSKILCSQKLYRPEAGSPEGVLTPTARVSPAPSIGHRIHNQYDEIVKYATALRLYTADAESILRRFTRNNLQHPTYRALAES